MKRNILTAICTVIVTALLANQGVCADRVLTISTTTSTQASGLLDILLPVFQTDTGIRVKVIAKGTGAAIRDGMDGNVDLIFVHALARENRFVKDGYGTRRYGVMHNDFVIVGPPEDPAGIKGLKNVTAALKKIAGAKARFISRGDESGTHTKEQALWRQSGLQMTEKKIEIVKKGKKRAITILKPKNSHSWYFSIGQGMGKVLTFADEKKAYTLTDRGTYLKYKYGRKTAIDLTVLCQGDQTLKNPYGVIPVSPEKHPHVKQVLAERFAHWIVSPRAQKLIGGYRLLGKPLFYPDALK